MLLDDPYKSMHIWRSSKSKQYLEKVKETSGIEPKKGYWSAGEIKQMKENVKLYQSLNPNVDVFKLLYEKKNKEKSNIFNETRFWDILSYNLCRKLENIHMSIMHQFMKQAGYKTGPYTKHEYSYLNQLVDKHGRDWRRISNLMNRSSGSLCSIYNLNVKNNINKGTWHTDEKERFLHIAKTLIQYNERYGLPLYRMNWRIVSDFVKTRTSASCHKFGNTNKNLLETLVNNDFTLLSRETIVLYIYFLKVQSHNAIDFKELVLLFNGKFTENELKEELNTVLPVLTNDNLREKIKSQYKSSIHEANNLSQRINFTNVLLSMKTPRTKAWLKAKYYLLVKENISEYNNKSAEEIITILHEEYCSDHTFENKRDALEQEACITDFDEISINSELNKLTIPSIDLMSDDEDEIELVDLTLTTDNEDDVTDDNDDPYKINDKL